MSQRENPLPAVNLLFLGLVLLLCPVSAIAQRHGGGHGMGGGFPGGSNRPTGLDEKDSLKDFHQALAVQATTQQSSEFRALVRSTEAAQAELQVFVQLSNKDNGTQSAQRGPLDNALEMARQWNKRFQEGFSPVQKSGLKEILKKLAKADSDVEQEQKMLDQSLDLKAARIEVAVHSESLDKGLSYFHDQQLAVGREMSIVVANGQDMAFTLPQVKSPIRVDNQTIVVGVSGSLSQIAAQGSERTFKLELSADLSDLQQDITELLRAQLDASPVCGQRVAIRRATLAPSTPASLLVVQLHFERWICTRTDGQQTSNELGEGDGTVEIKLTAIVENPNTLKVAAAFGRIDAAGMLGEALRSGDLGEDLRDKAAQLVLLAARAGSDFKIALPPAVQNSATIQSVKFHDENVGGLSVALEGQVEISNEQANQLASQLNQALSAETVPSRAPGTIPQLSKRPQ